MPLSASVKYWVLIALGLVLAVGTYLQGQPVVTEGVVLGGVLVGATFLVSEFEGAGTSTST